MRREEVHLFLGNRLGKILSQLAECLCQCHDRLLQEREIFRGMHLRLTCVCLLRLLGFDVALLSPVSQLQKGLPGFGIFKSQLLDEVAEFSKLRLFLRGGNSCSGHLSTERCQFEFPVTDRCRHLSP